MVGAGDDGGGPAAGVGVSAELEVVAGGGLEVVAGAGVEVVVGAGLEVDELVVCSGAWVEVTAWAEESEFDEGSELDETVAEPLGVDAWSVGADDVVGSGVAA